MRSLPNLAKPAARWTPSAATTRPMRPSAPTLVIGTSSRPATRPASQGVRLDAPARELVERLKRLATVTAITRNDGAALEMTGSYVASGSVPACGAAIGLELCAHHWADAAIVRGVAGSEPTRALVVSAADGSLVHEARVRGVDAAELFDAVFADVVAREQSPHVPARRTRIPRENRREAFAYADLGHAWPVELWSLGEILDQAVTLGVSLTVMVGNVGARQRWAGPVRAARTMTPWVAMLADGVRLHVRGDRVAQAWVSRRLCLPGHVTTLELLDASGEQMLALTGAGQVDDRAWLELVAALKETR